MGFWRTIYNIIGLDYIGSKEQEIIDRQKHLKYMVCKQVKEGGLKLKPNNKELFITKIIKNRKKKKGLTYY